ncbi:MAG: hypothetical protein DMF50_02115 [Acidobacteria bacterium]|nr:MAG: hypothetical protein DMF50_02115 [Acidobacteriota bacterium]
MNTSTGRRAAQAAALLLTFAIAGCQKSDVIAPDGATITLQATPTNVVLASTPDCINLLNVTTCGTAIITATVASKLGVPLSGQDVRFNSTAGLLFIGDTSNPQIIGSNPVRTDRFGNAQVNLITSTTTQVNARSGAASATPLSLSTVNGNLSQITLNLDTTSNGCSLSSTDIASCTQQVCLVATAKDASDNGIPGLTIVFALQNNVSGSNTFSGSFVPPQPTTDSQGEARTVFTPSSTCPAQCGGNKPCQGEIVASTQGGFKSIALPLLINIP